MSKIIKILLIILLTILVSGLIFFFVLLLNNDVHFHVFQSQLIYDENILETFNNIQISANSLDVKLVKSENQNVNVKIYDRKDSQISVEVRDNTLMINNEHNSWYFLSFSKNEVIISLPENEYNLVINTKSGDIVSKLDLNTATIVATSGDTILNKVNDLVVNTTSGDIEISEVGDVIITSTSGDVIIGKINNSLNIETTSGDIEIDNLTIKKDSNIKLTSGDITINKSSDNIYYNAKATSGDIRINNNNRLADYELTINTISGDITVK